MLIRRPRGLLLLPAVIATYPLALAGHLATEWLFGDALLLRELQYGSQRAAAAAVLEGWWQSLLWVAGIWILVLAARRWLGRAHIAIGGLAALLIIAAAAGAALPSLLAWLLAAAYLLALALAWVPLRGDTR